jgi:hypothetical protein
MWPAITPPASRRLITGLRRESDLFDGDPRTNPLERSLDGAPGLDGARGRYVEKENSYLSRQGGSSTLVDFSCYLWRQAMRASVLYRIAAVLLLLFAVGHTLGFRQSDPSWGVDTLLGSMRSIHFDVQGFSRTYWDLFVAAGFSVGVFYLFAAILAWQLGGLRAETLALMRGTAWAFAACFAAITVVSWRYLFILPIAFSMVITVCLIAAAWLSAQAN